MRKKKSDSAYTVYVYSDSQPIASTPQPRHRPISLLMAFFIFTLLLLTFLQLKSASIFLLASGLQFLPTNTFPKCTLSVG
jgi:hypothetical protein